MCNSCPCKIRLHTNLAEWICTDHCGFETCDCECCSSIWNVCTFIMYLIALVSFGIVWHAIGILASDPYTNTSEQCPTFPTGVTSFTATKQILAWQWTYDFDDTPQFNGYIEHACYTKAHDTGVYIGNEDQEKLIARFIFFFLVRFFCATHNFVFLCQKNATLRKKNVSQKNPFCVKKKGNRKQKKKKNEEK